MPSRMVFAAVWMLLMYWDRSMRMLTELGAEVT